MSRYETFVIRLWMEEMGLDHGEVRHVGSGTGRRFRQVDEALEFVQSIVTQRSSIRGDRSWPADAANGAQEPEMDS